MPLGPFYALKASGVFAAIVLTALSRRSHHPFDRFGAANQVTMFRALLVAIAAGSIGEASAAAPWIGVAAGGAATALDGVDGWLARRTGMTSAFGARFDMEIDALLIQVLAILVWQEGKAGAWVLVSGLMRYAFVAVGWIRPWIQQPLFPSTRRKAICVVQIAGLLAALLPPVPRPASSLVAAASLAALSYSFLVDILWLWQRRPGA